MGHLTPMVVAACASMASSLLIAHNASQSPTRAPLMLNRMLPDSATVQQLYNQLASSGDNCINFPSSSDGCGQQDCSGGTEHHASCVWDRLAATVTGTSAPYTISADGLVSSSSGGCVDALSCVMGMFETSKYYLCQGDSIEATYSAAAGNDWFELALGMYQGTPGYNPTFIEKRIYRGSVVSNAVASFQAPQNGDYFVRLFGASYDRTGGTWLGARLTLESEFEAVGSCSASNVQQQNNAPPTPWPTPPATTPPTPPTPPTPIVSASGDPHMVNVLGEHFSLWRLGQVELLRVPRGATASEMNFSMHALVENLGEAAQRCSEAPYITSMTFRGKWFGDRPVSAYMQDGNLVAFVGDQKLQLQRDPLVVGRISESKNVSVHMPIEGHVVIRIGGARVDVVRDVRPVHFFLNMQARSLSELGVSIGGILGQDDHSDFAKKPDCSKDSVFLLRTDGTHPRGSTASASLDF